MIILFCIFCNLADLGCEIPDLVESKISIVGFSIFDEGFQCFLWEFYLGPDLKILWAGFSKLDILQCNHEIRRIIHLIV